jgi:uncharacterized membrane protein HdeD (DUF308 family)
MLSLIAKNWWLIVLRGVCAILFGLFAWTFPGVTLGALVMLWALYAIADGVLAFLVALSGASGRPWWVLALEGLVSIVAACAGIFYPGVTALVLLYVIAVWAIMTGILEIVAAVQLRKEIENELWLGLAGLASVFFGLLLIARPGVGVLAVMWIIGTYAIVFGLVLVLLGFRARALKNLVTPV